MNHITFLVASVFSLACVTSVSGQDYQKVADDTAWSWSAERWAAPNRACRRTHKPDHHPSSGDESDRDLRPIEGKLTCAFFAPA